MVRKGNHPQMTQQFRLVKYSSLPRWILKTKHSRSCSYWNILVYGRFPRLGGLPGGYPSWIVFLQETSTRRPRMKLRSVAFGWHIQRTSCGMVFPGETLFATPDSWMQNGNRGRFSMWKRFRIHMNKESTSHHSFNTMVSLVSCGHYPLLNTSHWRSLKQFMKHPCHPWYR